MTVHHPASVSEMRGVIFTNSKSLPGVGFPRNTKPRTGDPIGWNDIKDLQSGTDQRTIAYHAPFIKCDREQVRRAGSWGVTGGGFEGNGVHPFRELGQEEPPVYQELSGMF